MHENRCDELWKDATKLHNYFIIRHYLQDTRRNEEICIIIIVFGTDHLTDTMYYRVCLLLWWVALHYTAWV